MMAAVKGGVGQTFIPVCWDSTSESCKTSSRACRAYRSDSFARGLSITGAGDVGLFTGEGRLSSALSSS